MAGQWAPQVPKQGYKSTAISKYSSKFPQIAWIMGFLLVFRYMRSHYVAQAGLDLSYVSASASCGLKQSATTPGWLIRAEKPCMSVCLSSVRLCPCPSLPPFLYVSQAGLFWQPTCLRLPVLTGIPHHAQPSQERESLVRRTR